MVLYNLFGTNKHILNPAAAEEKLTNGNLPSSPEKDGGDHHRGDEQVNLCLECHNNQIKTLKRNYIRCSALATISHLKKFLAFKLYNNIEKCKDVSCRILCFMKLIFYFPKLKLSLPSTSRIVKMQVVAFYVLTCLAFHVEINSLLYTMLY